MAIGRTNEGGRPFPVIAAFVKTTSGSKRQQRVWGTQCPETMEACQVAEAYFRIVAPTLAEAHGIATAGRTKAGDDLSGQSVMIDLPGVDLRRTGDSVGFCAFIAMVCDWLKLSV